MRRSGAANNKDPGWRRLGRAARFGLFWRAMVRGFKQIYVWFLRAVFFVLRPLGVEPRVARRVVQLALSPQNPNNVFWASEASYRVAAPAKPPGGAPGRGPATPNRGPHRQQQQRRPVADPAAAPQPVAAAPGRTGRLSPGAAQQPDARRIAAQTALLNQQFSYAATLDREIRRLGPQDMDALAELIERLARRWRRRDDASVRLQRRNRLDVRATLRRNIPRYGGKVLDFRWLERQRPSLWSHRPARLLLIGDVSRSMAQYVSVVLYFFHQLGFRFEVQSYVFSEHPTWATPHMEGPGSFREKVLSLAADAASWNQGTRFGSSLRAILQTAVVDAATYVLIATDGKVAVHHGELDAVQTGLQTLSRRCRRLLFLTPTTEFAQLAPAMGHHLDEALQKARSDVSWVPIPLLDMRVLWYGSLAKYADEIHLCRTVRDLITMCERLIETRPGQ